LPKEKQFARCTGGLQECSPPFEQNYTIPAAKGLSKRHTKVVLVVSFNATHCLTIAVALREIKHYQKTATGFLIPHSPFVRLVRELHDQLGEERPGIQSHRWQSSALLALHEMAEHLLVMYFELLYFTSTCVDI
jgi:histone H3/H4